jgi:multisubunit Na+/H+ antiporter MnhG subunit
MMWYWIGVLLATIGATLILSALAFVSTLIGLLINAMIVLVTGPVIEGLLDRRGRAPAR